MFCESRAIRRRGVCVSFLRRRRKKRKRKRRATNRVERARETIFFGRRRNERTRFEREATASFVDFIRRRRRKKRNRAFFLRKFEKKVEIFSRENGFASRRSEIGAPRKSVPRRKRENRSGVSRFLRKTRAARTFVFSRINGATAFFGELRLFCASCRNRAVCLN